MAFGMTTKGSGRLKENISDGLNAKKTARSSLFDKAAISV